MADASNIPSEQETRARWGAFVWSPENAAKAAEIIARYPAAGRYCYADRQGAFA